MMKSKQKVNDFSNNNENFLPRTNFFVSLGFLIIQVLIPALVLFFVTGTDFTFTVKLPLWLMIVCTLSLILLALLVTLVTYKLHWHYLDQFTYVMPFAFLLGLFYLTGYFLSPDHLLIRFIIALGAAVIGIFITSIVLLVVVRRKQNVAEQSQL